MGDGQAYEAQSEEFCTARAVIYRALARCFSYPEEELLDLFDSARIEELLQSRRYLGLGAAENMSKVAAWLEAHFSREDALRELEKEYTRLFVNAYPHVIVPPYSSVHLDEDRLVWGRSTSEAVKLYTAAGLGIAKDFHDIPDHISAEMEFASYLIDEQQKVEGNNIYTRQELASIEKRFVIDHLLVWAPAFFSRVIDCSKTTFYIETALLAKDFVEWDAEQHKRS